jgi:type II secretion system protein C
MASTRTLILTLLLCSALFGPARLRADVEEVVQSIQLLGTISDTRRVAGTAARESTGVALLKHKASGQVQAIRIGEKAFNLATLAKVSRQMVVMRTSDGAEVTLTSKLGGALSPMYKMPPSVVANTESHYAEEGFERQGNRIRIDAAYRDRMVSKELPTILMSAASEPVMEGGKIKGFRLFQFEDHSIFQKMGMEDGDIVESINGVPLNDVARTIQFLNGLKNENTIEVTISRNGRPVNLNLSVN